MDKQESQSIKYEGHKQDNSVTNVAKQRTQII